MARLEKIVSKLAEKLKIKLTAGREGFIPSGFTPLKNIGITLKKKIGLSPGFTLIEMLVVIAIIGILAGFLMPALGKARLKAMNSKTESIIRQIETALAMYESDFGRYPVDSDPSVANKDDACDVAEELYTAVSSQPIINGTAGSPYMEFKSDGVCDKDPSSPDGSDEIADAWGNPIYYDLDDNSGAPWHNQYSFDLFSKGADGVTENWGGVDAGNSNDADDSGNNEDDLNNW